MSEIQNLQSSDPDLRATLQQLKREVFLELFCHHVGRITKFYPETQTADVEVVYKKTRFEQNDSGGQDAVLVDYPVLLDCPVFILGGGPAFVNVPIDEGDECLLLFNDRDIDDWYAGSTGAGNPTNRLHASADAFAIVGFRSLLKALAGFQTDRLGFQYGADSEAYAKEDGAGIKKGETIVEVKDKVKVQNAEQNLKTLLTGLIEKLTTLNGHLQDLTAQTAAITVSAFGSPPSNATQITAIGTDIGTVTTDLEQISTDLGELLE